MLPSLVAYRMNTLIPELSRWPATMPRVYTAVGSALARSLRPGNIAHRYSLDEAGGPRLTFDNERD